MVLVMIQAYLAFAAIAALVVIAPGPATFLVLKNTPTLGRRAGFLNTAGILVALLSHATLSLIGVSAAILAHRLPRGEADGSRLPALPRRSSPSRQLAGQRFFSKSRFALGGR